MILIISFNSLSPWHPSKHPPLNPTMRTLQITATVTPDHELKVQLPAEIPAGEYQIVLVMEEQPILKQRKPFKFPVDDYGSLLTEPSLRREDMYGDFGR